MVFQFDIAFLAFSFGFPTKAGGQGLQWLPCPTKLCHWRGSNWGRPVVYLQIVFNCWTRCPLRCYSLSGRILLHCFSRLVIHHLCTYDAFHISNSIRCFWASVCQNTGFLSNLPTSAYSEYYRIDNIYWSSICPCYDPFLDIHGLMVSNTSSEMTFCMPLVNFTTPKDRKGRLTRLPAKVRGRSMTNLTLKQRTRLTNTGPVDGGYWGMEDG